MINANLSYNFISERKSFPFVLIGYGLSNSLPTFNLPILNTGLTAGVFNAGGGVEAFIADNVAIRVEYR
jgi:opacity protein-like surface antigen